jgi:hypothetical protein
LAPFWLTHERAGKRALNLSKLRFNSFHPGGGGGGLVSRTVINIGASGVGGGTQFKWLSAAIQGSEIALFLPSFLPSFLP